MSSHPQGGHPLGTVDFSFYFFIVDCIIDSSAGVWFNEVCICLYYFVCSVSNNVHRQTRTGPGLKAKTVQLVQMNVN